MQYNQLGRLPFWTKQSEWSLKRGYFVVYQVLFRQSFMVGDEAAVVQDTGCPREVPLWLGINQPYRNLDTRHPSFSLDYCSVPMVFG